MWDAPKDKMKQLEDAIRFTSNHALYGQYMMRVVLEWKYSCENALTDNYLSHKAWVGHAAAAMAIGVPESVTREAWGHLTHEQQLLANKEAERAIQTWKYNRIKDRELRGDMGKEMLPGWYS